MAGNSNNVALAVAVQPVIDTFTAPTLPADMIPVSNLSMPIEGVTITNDEYTGSSVKNGDQVAGKRVSLSFTVKLRPPGAASFVSTANSFLLGRILQSAKLTELRTTAAIPAAPEAVSAGSTTGATLGAGAAATADLYKGMAISLNSMGTDYKTRMSAIRAYTAAKVATFIEQFGSTVTGNYQIPSQLGYVRDISSAEPIRLSFYVWLDGHRFSLMNATCTAMTIVVPTSTKDQAAFPEVQCSFDVTIAANTADATPSIPSLGAVPFFKDGDMSLANKQIGVNTFTVDLGLNAEAPPNPNRVDGVEASVLISTTAMIQMTRQKYLPSFLDTLALADAQAQHAMFAQWGSSAWNMVQVVVPDARFNYGSPDLGGSFINENGDLMVDAFSRGVCINFPG